MLKNLLACCILAFGPLHAHAQALIPQPARQEIHAGHLDLTSNIKIVARLPKAEKSRLTAVARALFEQAPSNQHKLVLLLTADGKAADAWNDAALQGYRLHVGNDTIRIEAPSGMGVFYGLQTLGQLIEGDRIPHTTIVDRPKYAHRGFMLDCSRHFWSVDFIKKQLDAMAFFKLDRFHFHLTDGGGWRLEIGKYPELTQKTAFRSHADWDEWIDNGRRFCGQNDAGAYGGYYSQAQIRDIVAYAEERYITVIPEIEMPGHSSEVLHAYPELSCTGQGDGFDLCVGNPKTFTFLTDVLQEVMQLFPSRYIHVGGDEATMRFWKKCPKCMGLYKAHHMTDTAQIQSHLMARVDSFLTAHGRKMLGWDEILDGNRLSPGATVMSWRGEKGGVEAARLGHHAIMSPSKKCYLDKYQADPSTQPKAIGGYTPLDSVYAYDPMPAALAGTPEGALIDGIQGNLWTEYVGTESHAEYMTYPRLPAIAERGWGTTTTYGHFRRRVAAMAKKMRAKGYTVFDVEQAGKPFDFTVLQWNIWQEGTMIKGGFDAIVEELARLKPDFVTLSEVRNYHDTNFTARLVQALKKKNVTYHSFLSYDTGVLSRYPIVDSVVVFPLNKDHGTIHKLKVNVDGRAIAVYTGHLDYLDCAYYNVRGYDGTNWKETARPASVDELLKLNRLSWRDDATRVFLNEARHDLAEGTAVIFGGDFNEPSHLDWTEATAQRYDHHGFVVPWTVSKMMEQAGFKDTYRELYPNPVTHPGFTYPCYNPLADIKLLTWAPKADERERIDYVYYQGKGLQATGIQIFGPAASVCRLKPVEDAEADPKLAPMGIWPTDHKGLLVRFRLSR